jgi:capsular polysaccharide biosynthesis protein
MSASQVDETEMFNVYIADADPEMAAVIANAVAVEAPAQIEEFVEGSSTKIVDYAKVPTEPYSPSLTHNVGVGAAAGIAAALAYLTLHFLLDVRIKDEQELEQLLELPILGRVPSFDHMDKKQKGY